MPAEMLGEEMKVPRCMSTQHPDNASIPFFSDSAVMDGETEVKEAFYAYYDLGCEEQMWDCEGKEVDSFVVRKLLSRYEYFFREKTLGEDVFLTLRVPNPEVERNEGKVLLEALESIPRNFDACSAFYGKDVAPIFEVILPMTTSAESLNRVYNYYKDFVAGKGGKKIAGGNLTVAEWVGELKPEKINMIPLLENRDAMGNAAGIVKEYISDKDLEYQRVFLARSDPALNYGSLSTVLMIKNAVADLHALEEKSGVQIYPIIGAGSAPFRGNLKPTNVEEFMDSYPNVQTLTLQSAFKYDYRPEQVIEAVRRIREAKRGKPREVDEERSMRIIGKVSAEYAKQIALLAPIINRVARYVPARRKRKLHVGLFGYSRGAGEVKLPRAITFCAALYSIGIPPEMLGLDALEEKDYEYISSVYSGFGQDLKDALVYLNLENLKMFPEIEKKILPVLERFEFETDEPHRALSKYILKKVEAGGHEALQEEIVKAATMRKFLG